MPTVKRCWVAAAAAAAAALLAPDRRRGILMLSIAHRPRHTRRIRIQRSVAARLLAELSYIMYIHNIAIATALSIDLR